MPMSTGSNRRTVPVFRLTLSLAALGLSLVLAACDNPPRGARAGRVGMTDVTTEEARSGRILPGALIEFSDQVAEEMAADIAGIPRVRDTEERVTVVLGDIENNTGVVSTNDFEMMMHRMRNRLNNQPPTQEKLRFVERRGRMLDLAQREGVAREDGTTGPDAYDPETTYALNGTVYRVGRGSVNLYYMDVQLTHFASNELVAQFMYETKRDSD
ncbi:MAG: hypothetical protein ACODAQ_10035 [Phycisphaeraceae bacterium]